MSRSGGVIEGQLGVLEFGTRPTNAIMQTHPRGHVGGSDLAALTTAQLFLVACPLPGGKTITSITFLSGATAVGTPLNQWYGLFDASLNVLGVTVDDTVTAWAANIVKTLALGARVRDGVTTNTSPTVTSATAAFVAGDAGKTITGAGIPAATTILSVQSGTSITLSANATATASGVDLSWARAVTYSVTATGLYYIGIMVKATTVPTLRGVTLAGTVAANLPPILQGTSTGSLTTPGSCPATAGALTVAASNPYAYVS